LLLSSMVPTNVFLVRLVEEIDVVTYLCGLWKGFTQSNGLLECR